MSFNKFRVVLLLLLSSAAISHLGAQPTATVNAKNSDTVVARGRVLGPDGKAVTGAKVYLILNFSEGGQNYPVRAISAADGRFEFSFAKSEMDTTYTDKPTVRVLAVAKNLGFDMATVGAQDDNGETTLRLVEDVPLNGRILDQEGKPVAGARVRVTNVRIFKEEDLTAPLNEVRKGMAALPMQMWTGPLPGQPTSVSTAADGKFSLTGLGRERLVGLIVEGPGIEYARLQAMTRVGEPVVNPIAAQPKQIYAARFDYLAAPARPIQGVVRDKDTGKPMAGVRITAVGTTHQAHTDKDGRYELLGYAKSKDYRLTAAPAEGQPYFSTTASFSDTVGLTPLAADFEMVRGIPVRGRVTDRETGQPVRRAVVAYHAVFPNRHSRDGLGDSMAITGPDGSFQVAALPGPGVLAVMGSNVEQKYMPALVTPKEMKEFYKDWVTPERSVNFNSEKTLGAAAGARAAYALIQENYHALVLLEPEANAEKLTCDVALRRALKLKGTVTGPDGKPFAGATVFGLTPNAFSCTTLQSAEFTVAGVNPKQTRELLFFHQDKGLGAHLVIRGDEQGPIAIKLQAFGTAVGRVVDQDGQQVAGLVLNMNRSRLNGPGGVQIKTDQNGRFRVDGLVPGQKYDLLLRAGQGFRRIGAAANIIVESGKEKDLGTIKIAD